MLSIAIKMTSTILERENKKNGGKRVKKRIFFSPVKPDPAGKLMMSEKGRMPLFVGGEMTFHLSAAPTPYWWEMIFFFFFFHSFKIEVLILVVFEKGNRCPRYFFLFVQYIIAEQILTNNKFSALKHCMFSFNMLKHKLYLNFKKWMFLELLRNICSIFYEKNNLSVRWRSY